MKKEYKIAMVVGNRPQFIKLLPVYKALKKFTDPYVIHTGQHHDYKMSEIFFQELDLPKPDVNLEVSDGKHGELTAKLLIKLEKEFIKIKPDRIILFGDTNSTMAAALAAVKLHIRISHVESGPRLYDNFESPEEANRVMTERISDLLFPPSQNCVNNLKLENRVEGVHFTGDTMYDTFKIAEEQFNERDLLKDLKLEKEGYYLLTMHRPRNVDEKNVFEKILKFLTSLDKQVLFPMHPRTKKNLEKFKLENYVENTNIIVTEPMGYLDLQYAVRNSIQVFTDSGGLQKEAYFAKKRCLTLYPETPWPEIQNLKFIKCFDPVHEDFSELDLNWETGIYELLFGNGDAGEKIASIIKEKKSENLSCNI